MFKKSLLVITLIVTICVLIFAIKIISMSQIKQYYEGKVDEIINGNILKLSEGGEIQLAGAYIPVPEDTNYRQELRDNIQNLLVRRSIKYEIIEKKIRDYPKYDLAIVYVDDAIESINEILLKEGMAFFDHGYYEGKDKFYKLEQKAENEKRGIWRDKNTIVLLYIGGKNWWNFHYADCLRVNSIKEKNRIYYYIAPPVIVFYRGFAVDCKYCKKLDKIKGVNREINYLR